MYMNKQYGDYSHSGNHRKYSLLEKLGVGIATAAVFVMTLVFLIGSIIGSSFDAQNYVNSILNEKFDEQVLMDARETVHNQSAIIEIPLEDAVINHNEVELVRFARGYTAAFVEAAVSGTAFEYHDYKDDALKGKIETLLKEFTSINSLEYSEEDLDEIYTLTINNVNNAIKFIPQPIIDMLPQLTEGKAILDVISTFQVPSLILLVAACAAIAVIKNAKKVWRWMYGASSALWIGSALVFIPSVMLFLYDAPSKLVFSQSLLQLLVSGVFHVITRSALIISGVAFVFSSAAVIVSICVITKHRKNRRKKYATLINQNNVTIETQEEKSN